MKINPKSKIELFKIFSSLESSEFDENDIKNILIHFRSIFNDQNLIWEFASFVAHKESRNRGIFHERMNVNYLKLKHIHASENKITFDPFIIDENIFEFLLIGSVKNLTEKILLEKTKLSRKESLNIIKNSYTKKDSKYVLTKLNNLNSIISIAETAIGTLEASDIFNIDMLTSQFEYCLKKTSSLINYNFNTKKFIKENKYDLIFCLMCMIHSHTFRLYDGVECSCELGLLRDQIQINSEPTWSLKVNAKVTISYKDPKKELHFVWAMMSLNNKVDDFIPDLQSLKNTDSYFFQPNVFALRDLNNRIILSSQ